MRTPKPDVHVLTGLSAAAKVTQLSKQFRGRNRALVLPHDNPDPDSLASAWALAVLLQHRLGMPSDIAYGGIIGRAENSAFVNVLRIPVRPIADIRFEDYDLFALLDTQQGVRNHALPDSTTADIVIDHHPVREGPLTNPYADVGDNIYGATATMLTEYLRAAKITPSPELATALYYGIKADTRNLERQTSAPDVDCFLWLFPQIDRQHLAQIEHPELPLRYFRMYHAAIEKARVYTGGVMTDLGEVYSPDMVAEVAERLLFVEGSRWSLSYGSFRNQLFLSLRLRDRRFNAGRLMRETCADFGGSAGGHGSMAGARLPLAGTRAQREAFRRKVIRKFKTVFGVQDERGVSVLSDES
jgi:nanoRNase/pAp phosphatase (c-di-AMP/oligoRNAs hydrolase)